MNNAEPGAPEAVAGAQAEDYDASKIEGQIGRAHV